MNRSTSVSLYVVENFVLFSTITRLSPPYSITAAAFKKLKLGEHVPAQSAHASFVVGIVISSWYTTNMHHSPAYTTLVFEKNLNGK